LEDYPRGEVIRYDGSLHPLVEALPHYHLVPKDSAGHIRFRNELLADAERSVEVQGQLRDMFASDVLFFINTMCYIVEPREGEYSEDGQQVYGAVPFNTWAHQDGVIAAMAHYFGRRHVVGDKSRAQGASWIALAIYLWAFLFRPYCILGLGSKDEETADDPDSQDSLGWKFDFLLGLLPPWLRPPGLVGDRPPHRSFSKSTWKNVLNGAMVKAYAATQNMGRSGRFTSFLMDEAGFFLPNGGDEDAVANLLRTTNSLWMISTPGGKDTEHYRRVYPDKPSRWLTVILDWEDNPTQRKGKYTTRNGVLQVLDDSYEYPEGYEFILDGRVRSPWFDWQCEDMGWNYLMIDRELCRKYSATAGRPFQDDILESHMAYTRVPNRVGRLAYMEGVPQSVEHFQWMDGEAYKFDVWVPLDGQDYPPPDRYTLGMDISAGTGGETSSNSVISIWNSKCEQVGECAINTLVPKEFAELVIATAYWFGRGGPSPLLIWERNGPGVPFTTEVLRQKYNNIYWQRAKDDTRRYASRTDKPGYFNSDRQLVLDPLMMAMHQHKCVIRSRALIEEAGQYEYGKNNKIVHPKSKTTRDASAAGENHGDRVIAAAMAMRAYFEQPAQQKKKVVRATPRDNTLAGYMLRLEGQKVRPERFCRW